MPATANESSMLNGIELLMAEVNGHAKQAGASKRAGGYGSEPDKKTTHPSGSVDDGTMAQPHGARAAENERDIKNDKPLVDVDDKERMHAEGDGAGDSNPIGTRKSMNGGDPAAEDDFGSRYSDPGTSHPANANEIGEKYSSLSFPDLYAVCCRLTDAVITRLATESVDAVKAATANTNLIPTDKTAEHLTPEQAAALGYDAAALAAVTPEQEAEIKYAAALQVTASAWMAGSEEADMVGEIMWKYDAAKKQQRQPQQVKRAEGLPPDAANQAMAGMAGQDPTAGMGGGDGTAGGMGAEMGGGSPGGGGQEDEANEILAALMEAGIDPNMLLQALHGGGGEGGGDAAAAAAMGGGAPPDAGGEAEPKAASAQKLDPNVRVRLIKVATDLLNYQRSGRFHMTAPRNEVEKKARQELKNYFLTIRELVGV